MCSSTTSPNDLPVRSASKRHANDRHDRLCSSVRLSAFDHAGSAAATALRIAGPITGKSASASGAGLLRTEAVIARSTGGVSAWVKRGSEVCSTRTWGRMSADFAAARRRVVEPLEDRGELIALAADEQLRSSANASSLAVAVATVGAGDRDPDRRPAAPWPVARARTSRRSRYSPSSFVAVRWSAASPSR